MDHFYIGAIISLWRLRNFVRFYKKKLLFLKGIEHYQNRFINEYAKKVKFRNHGVPQIFWWDIEEITFLITAMTTLNR